MKKITKFDDYLFEQMKDRKFFDAYISEPCPKCAQEQARSWRYRESLRAIRLMVEAQAEDEGLWGVRLEGLQSIVEAYLQQELRRLHECVEHYIKAALADEGGAQ